MVIALEWMGLIACALLAVCSLTYVAVSYRRDLPLMRLEKAHKRIHRIFRDTTQKMNRVTGHDPFNFGPKDQW